MPPWLQQSFQTGEGVTPLALLWRFSLAFILGCAVAWIYRGTHRREPIAPNFPRTLVLLSILIAMVTSVIGDNVARAFSLVGALSIVRFRTVVQDTQDTAFVIFAVIIGMAAGADHLWVALIGLGIVGVAIVLLRPRRKLTVWSDEECQLCVRVGAGHKPEDLLNPVFEKHVRQFEVVSVGTAKQGISFDLTYRVRLDDKGEPMRLVEELNQTTGVQSVELRRIT